MVAPTLTVEVTLDPKDAHVVVRGLEEHAKSVLGVSDARQLAAFFKDGGGNVVGGVLGCTFLGWLAVGSLWVRPEDRRNGYGTKLMRAAEEEAVRRGCKYAYLHTYSWNAPTFFEKLGYRAFGTRKCCPEPGMEEYSMEKPLVVEESE